MINKAQVSNILEFFSAKRSAKKETSDHADKPPARLDKAKLERLRQLTADIPTGRHEANAWNAECATLIDELVVSRLSSGDLASIFAGLVSYQKTGVTPSESHLAWVDAFGKTSGLLQEIFHYGMFPRANVSGTGTIFSPHFGSVDVASRAKIIGEIREAGYSVLPIKLDRDTVVELNKAARKLSFGAQDRHSTDVPESYDGIDPDRPPRCGAIHAKAGQLAAVPIFKHLADDPLIVALASEYLETPVSAIDSVLWYTFPATEASSELAQLFHYDLDTLRWLKVFYYLSDVGETNGPHEYVEGSHPAGAKSQELLDRGYSRISDADMRRLQPGQMRSITGSAGTVILGDTRAFHKGQRVQSGYRLIYCPIYAPSRIGFVHAM